MLHLIQQSDTAMQRNHNINTSWQLLYAIISQHKRDSHVQSLHALYYITGQLQPSGRNTDIQECCSFQNVFCQSLIFFYTLGLAETCIHLSHIGLSQSGRHTQLLLINLARGICTNSCSIQLIKRQLIHLFKVFWQLSGPFVLSLQQLSSLPVFYPELRKCLCSFPLCLLPCYGFFLISYIHSLAHICINM